MAQDMSPGKQGLENQVKELLCERDELHNELAAARSDVHTAAEAGQELLGKVGILEIELSQLHNCSDENEQLRKENAELVQRCEQLEASFESLRQSSSVDTEKLRGEVQARSSRFDRKKTEVQRLESEVADLSDSLQKTISENDALRTELDTWIGWSKNQDDLQFTVDSLYVELEKNRLSAAESISMSEDLHEANRTIVDLQSKLRVESRAKVLSVSQGQLQQQEIDRLSALLEDSELEFNHMHKSFSVDLADRDETINSLRNAILEKGRSMSRIGTSDEEDVLNNSCEEMDGNSLHESTRAYTEFSEKDEKNNCTVEELHMSISKKDQVIADLKSNMEQFVFAVQLEQELSAKQSEDYRQVTDELQKAKTKLRKSKAKLVATETALRLLQDSAKYESDSESDSGSDGYESPANV